jgi:hypothetical protein
MALQKAALKNSLKIGFKQILSNPSIQNNVDQIANQMAILISDNIDVFVKTGNAVGTDSDGNTHALTIE